ncbi:TPA_asm: P4 protein [Trachyspermum ammi polerovirus]|uniref:P4 protein n=1 Tax=Trachyspermum ammi polerovirus TaxID=2885089 RepID=A0AAD2KQS4_9VIRU|nr:TPA_asm: P4 protein [Trachyspermum ammi polerovirus]
MDLQEEHKESNPWLLSTHLGGAHVDAHNQSRSLWFQPPPMDEDDEDAEDAVLVAHEQWAHPEAELVANNSCFRRTISRATPTATSPSARTYQTTQLSVQDCYGPSMSIRSQTCELYSSRKPHPLPPVRSLTSWTPTANFLRFQAKSSSSGSPKADKRPGLLKRLTGRNGTPLQRTNSDSYGGEMAIIHK